MSPVRTLAGASSTITHAFVVRVEEQLLREFLICTAYVGMKQRLLDTTERADVFAVAARLPLSSLCCPHKSNASLFHARHEVLADPDYPDIECLWSSLDVDVIRPLFPKRTFGAVRLLARGAQRAVLPTTFACRILFPWKAHWRIGGGSPLATPLSCRRSEWWPTPRPSGRLHAAQRPSFRRHQRGRHRRGGLSICLEARRCAGA